MRWHEVPRPALVFALVLGLAALPGCSTTNTEMVAKAIAEKPQSSCQLPLGPDGGLVSVTGEACDRAVTDFAKAARSSACADFAQDNETVCMFLATFGDRLAGGGGYQDTDVQLLIAAMQEDGKDRRQIRGLLAQFGIVGIQETGATVRNSNNNKTTRALYEAFKGPRGDVHITKSDDGSGEGGRGGDGDQYVIIGDENLTTPGLGSAAADGRNPSIIAPGQNESILDPTFTNNQNASAPENPINNAPITSTEDNDGSGDNSIIPGFK